MNKPQQSAADWQPFPSGTLVSFAGRERIRQRRQFLTKAGTVTAALVVSLTAGYFVIRPSQDAAPNFGGIACAEVRDSMSQYASGKLSPAHADNIRVHLEHCPACQRAWQEMMQSSPHVSDVSYLDPDEFCVCPACQSRIARREPVFAPSTRGGDFDPVRIAMSR